MECCIIIVYKVMYSFVYHYVIHLRDLSSRNICELIIYLQIKRCCCFWFCSWNCSLETINIISIWRYNNRTTHFAMSNVFPSISCNSSCSIFHNNIIFIICNYRSYTTITCSNCKSIWWGYVWSLIETQSSGSRDLGNKNRKRGKKRDTIHEY